ncbi:protein cordon-bleu isoform X2 [Eleutherodactylus coqui]|uniref:protein cordon-bleu isoform X2 n=1 Tax=Eleutherodactylus coqui TaxID=57060 RepID=UPI003462660D
MEMPRKPPSSKKMKARAPPPPMRAAPKSHMGHRTSSESQLIGSQNLEESKENLLHRKMALTVCLPDGQEDLVTVDGSKAVMDFLVDLCSQHHLNPAQHTLEVRSGGSQQPFTLRPNTLIGTLDVETIFLKEKVTEVKVRKPPPKIPEKTVRLVVNFLGTQKAVVRVNPAVPLWNILPAVCDKCGLDHENVTLLRDAVSREELDMSRSLNELGIKELYVWGGRQEKKRSLSSSSDTTEKEKKGILGFFRSHKKGNKSEGSLGNVAAGADYEEVFRTASTSGNRYEGFLTAPSSPSATARPAALGASLSLSNISGIGSRPEMKKRRAPPPPPPPMTAAAEDTPADMSADQQYATVQKEQQKKKRRAPLPPTSQMPNEKYEDLENTKSSTGNERQVPQKPPRGNSRSPPQFMIPPPPSYPPPDNGMVELPGLENGATQTGPPRPIPAKREKRFVRPKSVSLEKIFTSDDAGSVNRYADNPGLVSSPSGSKSPAASAQPASNSEDSGGPNDRSLRAEDEVALVKNGGEKDFIAQQFQQTLAELEEDSEDMEDGDVGESSHIGARSSPVGEESSHYNDSGDHNAAVPVTVIDAIPEMYTLKYNTHNIAPVKEYNTIQQSADTDNTRGVDVLPEVEKPKHINSITYKSHQSVSQEVKSEYVQNPYASSLTDSIINAPQKQYTAKESLSSDIVIAAPSIKVSQEARPTKEIPAIMPEHKESTKPVLWRQQTYEPKVGMTTFTVVPPKRDIKQYDRDVSLSSSAIKIDDLGNLISPQSSFDKHHVQDAFANDTEGSLLEKPLLERAKEFWRSSSMESQAVESKEPTVKKLAPMKSYKPNQASDNKVSSTSFMGLGQQMPANKVNDAHKPMLTRSAASQERMIIVENTSRGRTEVSLARPAASSKSNGIQHWNSAKGENMTIIESTGKGKADLQAAGNDRPNGSQRTKPAQLLTASQEKVIIIEQPNQERNDLSFLKSSKRTSSQYVASAITKYVEPLNNKSIQTSVAKLDTNVQNRSNSSKSNGDFVAQEPKAEVKTMNPQEISVDVKNSFITSNGQPMSAGLQVEPTTKVHSDSEQFTAIKRGKSLSEQNGFSGSQSILRSTTVTKRTNIHSAPPAEPYAASRPISGLPSNAFLKAVREKSVKIEQANSLLPIRSAPATAGTHENVDVIPSTVIDEPDSPGSSNIFGPKARFRPVSQKPMQKDTSLHSALMGAIQSGEGKEKLRKIQSSPTDGGERRLAEPENERSALLSAIRAHNGISRLKKVPSAASEELQTLRRKETLQQDHEFVTRASVPSAPFPPPPAPPPAVAPAAPKSPAVSLNSPVNARDALLEAIRSGAGASRLKKVSASVHTL